MMNRCPHGVWIVPADWSIQASHAIPTSKRVSWACFVCREFSSGEYSEEALLELAKANCKETTRAAA